METKLHPVKTTGPLAGFGTMLKIEGSRWLSPKTILIQSIVWSFATQFAVIMVLIIIPATDASAALSVSLDMAIQIFIGVFSQVVAIGVIIVMQSALVGEKQSGTAAWILTNPVTRVSFILSKLAANTLGIMFMTIILQGAIGFGILSYSLGYMLPIGAFLVSMGLQTLHMLFYITLSLALGSFFNSRGPILGIGIGFIMMQDFIGGLVGSYFPWFPSVLPSMLNTYSQLVNLGQPIPSIVPIISVVVCTLVFTGLAIWRFNRTEF